MDAIATGIPRIEQPVTSRKHAAKADKPKGSFTDLLQKSLVPPTIETIYPETLSGADEQAMMKKLNCGNAGQNNQEKELTDPATFASLANADLLEMVKATLSHILANEGAQDDAPMALGQDQLPHVFSRLMRISDQVDDQNDNVIEVIISAFLQEMEETVETTGENVQQDDKWFDVLQTEILDVSEQDVSNLLDELLNDVNAAKIEPEQLLDLAKLMTILEANHPEQQQNMIAAQAERMIDQIENQKDTDKAAKTLLKLLEAWSSLAEQQRHKRDPVDTKVMSEGAKNILMNVQKNSDRDKHTIHASQPSSTMGISKIEQFVIHLQQQANSQTVDQQLIDQFQKAMKTKKFFTGNSGSTQLHITLKPENLGEMMVKLTQVNGEMTVKITVSAQATKDMLESNIHQLKHLFSPNQVIIEKHDLNVAEAQGFTNERGDQSMQKQEQEEHDSQQENQQQDQQEEENDTSFQDWLMNEKV